jgi:predicted PurR-regulated permease PerM
MTEAAAPQIPLPVPPDLSTSRGPLQVITDLKGPFAKAFVSTVAVLLAVSLGIAVGSLSTILMTVGIALFVALALNPLVLRLQARGATRKRALAIVFTGFVLVVGAIVAFVVPAAVGQVIGLAHAVPGYLADLQQSAWFQSFVSTTGGRAFWDSAVTQVQAWVSNPANLFALSSGVLAFGVGVINGVSTTMIVVVLTLYFLASMETMEQSLYELAPAYGRPKFAELTEQITGSVGSAIAGGVTLSVMNAAFSFVLLTLLGIPYAVMLAFLALIITTIPMIGSVAFWVIASVVALLYSWPVGVAFTILYFVYMQIEAYLITPRIMTRAISVPGSLVLIGAMIGASLLGLLGALLAGPVTASILLILRRVFIPKQDSKLSPDGSIQVPAAPALAAAGG